MVQSDLRKETTDRSDEGEIRTHRTGKGIANSPKAQMPRGSSVCRSKADSDMPRRKVSLSAYKAQSNYIIPGDKLLKQA